MSQFLSSLTCGDVFDQLSNLQVLAGLSALHRAIDRAVSLDDQRACGNAGGGDGFDVEEVQQGRDSSLEVRVAPAPAVADLVYSAP